jgi:NtrC-family two-component system response regulator AlgB
MGSVIFLKQLQSMGLPARQWRAFPGPEPSYPLLVGEVVAGGDWNRLEVAPARAAGEYPGMEREAVPADRSGLLVLVVDDQPGIRKTLSYCLEEDGHEVVSVGNPTDAASEASRRAFDAAFVDVRLGSANGLDLIPVLLAESPWMKIIVITAYASIETAVQAMKLGAADYIPKPFEPGQVRLTIRRVSELRSLEGRIRDLSEELARWAPEVSFSTSSVVMRKCLETAAQVAASDAAVLLKGESGTGKSVLARAIHHWSPRAARPFTAVSCPSIPPELLESELFGHAKGAFTGAVQENPGRMAATEGGTLFLDEVGDLPLSLQPKLLRFLQEKEYERVGDPRTRRADIRLISASNADLEVSVREGIFRQDLYYRLDVIEIRIPSLRERREDIAPLAETMLRHFCRINHRTMAGFSPEALDALQRYGWPGNLRELRNAIERAVILSAGDVVGMESLPGSLASPPSELRLGDHQSISRVEEEHIRRVLASTGSLTEAARILGIDETTLWRRRKAYGI